MPLKHSNSHMYIGFCVHLSLLAILRGQKPYGEGASITMEILHQSMLVHEFSQTLLSLVVCDAASVVSFSGDDLHPILVHLLDYSTEVISLECNMSIRARQKCDDA